MVTNSLFAAPLQVVVAQVKRFLGHLAQVRLDRELVLGGRGHDARRTDRTGVVDLIGVEQQAARGLGRSRTYRTRGTTVAAGGFGGS